MPVLAGKTRANKGSTSFRVLQQESRILAASLGVRLLLAVLPGFLFDFHFGRGGSRFWSVAAASPQVDDAVLAARHQATVGRVQRRATHYLRTPAALLQQRVRPQAAAVQLQQAQAAAARQRKTHQHVNHAVVPTRSMTDTCTVSLGNFLDCFSMGSVHSHPERLTINYHPVGV